MPVGSLGVLTTVGLHVDTENLLKGGRLTQEEYCQRSVTFWSCFCQETMWAIYIGRTPLMGDYEEWVGEDS